MKDSERFISIVNTAIRYCKWLIAILAVAIACSGIRVVNNSEVAVVLRFGRLVGDTREEVLAALAAQGITVERVEEADGWCAIRGRL